MIKQILIPMIVTSITKRQLYKKKWKVKIWLQLEMIAWYISSARTKKNNNIKPHFVQNLKKKKVTHFGYMIMPRWRSLRIFFFLAIFWSILSLHNLLSLFLQFTTLLSCCSILFFLFLAIFICNFWIFNRCLFLSEFKKKSCIIRNLNC